MFEFHPCFNLDKLSLSKNSRFRVVGTHYNDNLLVSVNSGTKTEIYLVSKNGSTTLVISMKYFIDIVCADLSSDQEMIFFCERVSNGATFGFKGVIWHIHSFAQSKAFEEKYPIYGLFVPDSTQGSYQIIHFVGSQVLHIKISFAKKKIETSTLRTGIQMNECYRWYISKSPLYVVCYKAHKNISLYQFQTNGQFTGVSYNFDEHPKSILPSALALNPSNPQHLYHFHFSRSNMIVLPLGSDIGIVEQLYYGEDSFLTFSVGTVQDKYYEVFTVDNVQPDIPISFLSEGRVVYALISSVACYIIDFSSLRPLVFRLPKAFSLAPFSMLSTCIGIPQHIIDLESGGVFSCSISLKTIPPYLDMMDKQLSQMIATLCMRLPQCVNISAIFHHVIYNLDLGSQLYFFETFVSSTISLKLEKMYDPKPFSIFSRHESTNSYKIPRDVIECLDDMEKEFPSSGNLTRKNQFEKLVKYISSINGKIINTNSFNQALRILQKHNESSLLIRSAIDSWNNIYHPDSFHEFILRLLILSISQSLSIPSVPCLSDETTSLAITECPIVMFRKLRYSRIIHPVPHSSKREIDEFDYWKYRIPTQDSDSQNNTLSSISLSRSSRGFQNDERPSEVSIYTGTE